MQSTKPREIEARTRQLALQILLDLTDEALGEVQAQAFPSVPIVFDGKAFPAVWGLRPQWSERSGKSKDGRLATLNCQSEEMFQKASFKALAPTRRCLVPVDYFVDWRHEASGKKTRFRVALAEGEPLYLGGLCQEWEGETYFTVCTLAANAVMRYVHNSKMRMPLVVREPDIALWLTPGGPEALAPLTTPNDELPLVAVAEDGTTLTKDTVPTEEPGQGELF